MMGTRVLATMTGTGALAGWWWVLGAVLWGVVSGATQLNAYYTVHPSLQLDSLQVLAKRVQKERSMLRQQMDTLSSQSRQLLDKMEETKSIHLPGLRATGDNQNNDLITAQNSMESLMTSMGALGARMAGEKMAADKNENYVSQQRARLDDSVTDNNHQEALIAKVTNALEDAQSAVQDKLDSGADRIMSSISAMNSESTAFADLLATRNCYTDVVPVDIGEDHMGEAELIFNVTDNLNGRVPSVFCSLQGLVSRVNLDTRLTFGYGYKYGYRQTAQTDLPQDLSAAISCSPQSDRVVVRAFDHSQGHGNGLATLIVQVRACSLTP